MPFFIRAGKCLPVTSTEIVVRLRRPLALFPNALPLQNYFRFRILPGQTVAFGITAMDDGRRDDRPAGRTRREPTAGRQ